MWVAAISAVMRASCRSQEQNAELESLAKGRLEELEKLSADRQKLYQLCDELLSEAERRQSAKA